MLLKLKIQRFKSIYEADLEFGRVNLFVGPNGSGKSNLLEALGILAAALGRGIDQSALDVRGVRLSLPRLFKSAFKGVDLPKTFRLEAQFENGRYECSIHSGQRSSFLEFHSEALYEGARQVFGRGPRGAKIHTPNGDLSSFDGSSIESSRSIWDLISAFKPISEPFAEELSNFSRYAIYAPQTAVMRGLAIDSRVVEPLGLTGSGLAHAFEQMWIDRRGSPAFRRRVDDILRVIWAPGWADQIITGSFDSDIVPPQVRSEGSLLYIRDKYMKTGRNFLSPFDASEGTLYLIFVATLLAHKETPKSFALDNVDGTLNPDLVKVLTDHIVKVCDNAGESPGDYQSFMTSHHPSALDSFDIFSQTQRVFTVSRGGKAGRMDGTTKFRRLIPPSDMSRDDWAILSAGKNLSELMLEGAIPGALS